MKRTYYKTCEFCGSNLDPAEVCDCQKEREKDGYKAEESTFRRIQNIHKFSGVARKETEAVND